MFRAKLTWKKDCTLNQHITSNSISSLFTPTYALNYTCLYLGYMTQQHPHHVHSCWPPRVCGYRTEGQSRFQNTPDHPSISALFRLHRTIPLTRFLPWLSKSFLKNETSSKFTFLYLALYTSKLDSFLCWKHDQIFHLIRL